MRRTRCNEGLVWDEPRWHREHYKVVTDFGAVGDSAADDTASIQAAMKNGGIKKIHHVDYEVKHFLGIYAEFTTVVYGE